MCALVYVCVCVEVGGGTVLEMGKEGKDRTGKVRGGEKRKKTSQGKGENERTGRVMGRRPLPRPVPALTDGCLRVVGRYWLL